MLCAMIRPARASVLCFASPSLQRPPCGSRVYPAGELLPECGNPTPPMKHAEPIMRPIPHSPIKVRGLPGMAMHVRASAVEQTAMLYRGDELMNAVMACSMHQPWLERCVCNVLHQAVCAGEAQNVKGLHDGGPGPRHSIAAQVLDAPQFADDFYRSQMDWGPSNVLAICLGKSVYLWKGSDSTVR